MIAKAVLKAKQLGARLLFFAAIHYFGDDPIVKSSRDRKVLSCGAGPAVFVARCWSPGLDRGAALY